MDNMVRDMVNEQYNGLLHRIETAVPASEVGQRLRERLYTVEKPHETLARVLDKLYRETETWREDSELSAFLAYLSHAILLDREVEVEPNSEFHQLLQTHFNLVDPVWSYIDLEEDNVLEYIFRLATNDEERN